MVVPPNMPDHALPGYQMAVVDPAGPPLGPGQESDLAIPAANPCLMLRHWGNPDGLRAACRGDWFITGDRGWVDQDGYFWFIGRGDDVILSAGYRIGTCSPGQVGRYKAGPARSCAWQGTDDGRTLE